MLLVACGKVCVVDSYVVIGHNSDLLGNEEKMTERVYNKHSYLCKIRLGGNKQINTAPYTII